MMFQVIKNGKVMFWTDYESCIPPDELIKEMKKAGYKIKIKGEKQNGENRE